MERKIHLLAMSLPHSDACFVKAYPGETTEAFCDGHVAGFAFFGGVPHYVFDDTASGRELGLFGREHLAFIREKLGAEGLARSPEVRPEVSHAWRGTLAKL